jgi:hypothetical protein
MLTGTDPLSLTKVDPEDAHEFVFCCAGGSCLFDATPRSGGAEVSGLSPMVCWQDGWQRSRREDACLQQFLCSA